MNPSPGHTRRSFFHAAGVAELAAASARVALATHPQAPNGNVIGSPGGEHLVHFRDGGNLFIKFGAASDSANLAMGTQQVTAGAGIPVHRHLHMDEAFYILDGSGTFLLDDVPTPIEKGSAIFIPKGTWHGFVNPAHELLLIWTMTPAGFEGFFRDTCSPPGAPRKQFTREQIHAIALKYETEFR